jgi:mannosyl-oligosaccharide alpha-1,2-mannosidase
VHVPQRNCAEIGGGGSEGGGEGGEGGEGRTVGNAGEGGQHDGGATVGDEHQAQHPATGAASSSAASDAGRAAGGGTVPRFDYQARELTLSELQALDADGGAAVGTKRLAIVHALRHAWKGYETHAFGQDEVRPLSGGANNWIGLGLTILDSLDVLWLAGLREEFAKGVQWVHSSLRFDQRKKVSFFETTIRCLGGLLAAYELCGDATLLAKATELGDRLGKAFASGSGLPYTSVSLADGSHTVPSWLAGSVLLAEVGTVQLEFAALDHHAGRAELRAKSDRVFALLDEKGPTPDASGGRLWPIHIRPETGVTTGSTITWGAMGDSFYEYLLKYWLLTGKRHEQYKRMYLDAVKGMVAKLLFTEDGLTFIAESKNGRIDKKVRRVAHWHLLTPPAAAAL